MAPVFHRLSATALLGLSTVVMGCPFASVRVSPGDEPALVLLGKWDVTLHLDSARLWQATPADSTAIGTVEFALRYYSNVVRAPTDTAPVQYGKFDIDLRPLWGGRDLADASTTVFPGVWANPWEEAIGFLLRDSVLVVLRPHTSHAGIAMAGALSGDSLVEGSWALLGNMAQADGHFIMRRRG